MIKRIFYKEMFLYFVLLFTLSSAHVVYGMWQEEDIEDFPLYEEFCAGWSKKRKKKQKQKLDIAPGAPRKKLPSFQELSFERGQRLFDSPDNSNQGNQKNNRMQNSQGRNNSIEDEDQDNDFGFKNPDLDSSNGPNFDNFSFNNPHEVAEEDDVHMRTVPKRDSDFEFKQNNCQAFNSGYFRQNNWQNQNPSWGGNRNRGNYNGFNRYNPQEQEIRRKIMQEMQQKQRIMQRETEAEHLLWLLYEYCQYGDKVLTMSTFPRIKSFLLSLEVFEVERFIKLGLVDSSLRGLFKKCFAEIGGSPKKAPTMTAYMNQIAAKTKQKLYEISALVNLGISPEDISYYALFGLYWFDIKEILDMGANPVDFSLMSMHSIRAIVKNKKYMRTFIKLGFTAKELLDSIDELGELHEELMSLKKDNSQISILKRQSFMGILAMKLRSHQVAPLCDTRSTGFGGFYK